MQGDSNTVKKHTRSGKRRLYDLVWMLALALLAVGSAATYTRLNIQIEDIRQKKDVAEHRRDDLALEVKRMQRLIEYSKMNEYRQQLAVDHLGYVGPDDIKFVQAQDDSKGEIEVITEDDY